jgi:hypothetical protein
MKLANLQVLLTFLSRLSKREKVIFYTAATFVALMLLDHLIIIPIWSHMRSLKGEMEEKELGISRSLRILAQKDRIVAESAHYNSYFGTFMSEEEETTVLLKEIERLANKSSVYLIDLKPAGLKTTGGSKRYLINLNCEAQMEQVVEFLYNVENSDKLLTVERYQITPKSKESKVAKCNIAISKIAAP